MDALALGLSRLVLVADLDQGPEQRGQVRIAQFTAYLSGGVFVARALVPLLCPAQRVRPRSSGSGERSGVRWPIS